MRSMVEGPGHTHDQLFSSGQAIAFTVPLPPLP